MNTSPCQWLALVAGTSLLSASVSAQTQLAWSKNYATPTLDQASCVVVDATGQVFAAGTASANAAQSSGSAFFAAWDANGMPLWSGTFDASSGGAEFPSAIELDGQGGIYVVGGAANLAQTQWHAFVLRIAANGAVAWSRAQPITGTPRWTPSLAVDGAGRAIVGGRAPSGNGDLSIAAYSALGNLDWTSTYDSGAMPPDEIVDLAIAPGGDIVAVGTLSSTSAPTPVLMRVSSTGAQQFVTTLPLPLGSGGFGRAIAVAPDGRTYLAASATGNSPGMLEILVSAYDSGGQQLWVRTIAGPMQSPNFGAEARDIAVDPFGRVVVLGSRAQGTQGIAVVLATYDSNGTEIWSHIVNDVLGGPATNLWNIPSDLVVTPAGDVIAVGLYAPALADTVGDAFALGYDAQGAKRFGVTYGLPPTAGGSLDYAAAVAVAPGDAFVVVGRAQTGASTTGFDGFVARYERTAVAYCFGDGTSTACPCGNASAPVERAGCANSFGTGARLIDTGMSSLSADTLHLEGSGMPNAGALYLQASLAAAAVPFGDGLQCIDGIVRRLGTRINASGASTFPALGDPTISTRGMVTQPGQRYYQIWYRNAAPFCTSAAFNFSNGLRVTWTP